MSKLNKIMVKWMMLWAALFFAMLAACSSDTNVAGTFIETNTGNKVMIETNTGNYARVMISVADFGIFEGDTLQLSRTERDTVGDTIFTSTAYHEKIASNTNVAAGYVIMDSVPATNYDSLTILPVNGNAQSIAIYLDVKNDESYYLDSNTAKVIYESRKTSRKGKATAYLSLEYLDSIRVGDTLRISTLDSNYLDGDSMFIMTSVIEHEFSEDEVLSKVIFLENLPEGIYKNVALIQKDSTAFYATSFSLTASKKIFAYLNDSSSNAFSDVKNVAIQLPEGFEDLSSVDESFKDMPFPIRVEKPMNYPCLVDANSNVILLEENESDSLLYWGRMEIVNFAKDGSIKFDLLDNCNRYKDSVTLARRAVHLDNETPSENATERFENMDAAFGNALWTDSTDNWKLIDNFEPFTQNGYQMSASIWIKADSASQPTPGKNYTRLLAVKKDSIGFALQQRADHPAVNVRIDAHKDGKGVYNMTYGNAWILDGTWHNYSLTIRGDSLYTYADGVIVSKNQFENGSNFASCTNPAIGYDRNNFVGGLDEIFFFDGSQTENWMRLFYALQKQAR